MSVPRKHVTLTIHKKYEIIKMLDQGVSYPKIAKMFGIGKTTVADIKKKKQEILDFITRTERGPGRRKTLKNPEHPAMENALFTWFSQQRRLNVPVSGEVLMEKARFLSEKFINDKTFIASRGWLERFKKRHGIRHLKITNDKSNNREKTIEPSYKRKHELLRNRVTDKEIEVKEIATNEELEVEEKKEDYGNEHQSRIVVSDQEAFAAFNKCIQWAEENNISNADILLLCRIRDGVLTRTLAQVKQEPMLDHVVTVDVQTGPDVAADIAFRHAGAITDGTKRYAEKNRT